MRRFRNWLFATAAALIFAGQAPLSFAGEREGSLLREFLGEIISTGSLPPQKQPDAIRSSLAKHAGLLPHLVDPEKTDLLLKDAQLVEAFSMVSKERSLHDALYVAFRDEAIYMVREIMGFHGIDPSKLQGLEARLDQVRNQLQSLGVSRQISVVLKAVEDLPVDERMNFLRRIPDSAFLALNSEIGGFVEKAKFSATPSLSLITRETENLSFSGISKNDTEFLSNSFLRYFDELPVNTKRKIIAAWLALPPGASQERQLAEVLQNAGPALQKMFQLFGREAKSEQLKEILRELLSNVKPFPPEEAKALVSQNLGRPIEEVFSSFDDTPLAAGTVGQVHKAKLKSTGQDVIVKVLRPGLREEMHDEFEVFKRITAEMPAVEQLVLRLQDNFTAELDLLNEARNLEEAKRYLDPEMGISVPRLIEETKPSSNVLVMEMAKGTPLAKSPDLDPRIKGQALYITLKKWFEEAMFASGFFHGDMHPGNILLEKQSGKNPPFHISIIDAGSAGKMSVEQRRNFLRFFAAVMKESPEEIVNALRGFGKIPDGKRAEIVAVVNKALKDGESFFDRSQLILSESLKTGMELDPGIVMFNRANFFLYRELEHTNAEIARRYPKAQLYKPTNAYLSVALKRAGIEIPRNLFNAQAADESVFETRVLKELFVSGVKATYRDVRDTCIPLFADMALAH